MLLSVIAAVSRNMVIGRKGGLPWRIPEDLRWFKRHTLGHPVIMGRRTFESMGGALPGRYNILITTRKGPAPPGVTVARSFEEALARAGEVETGESFVIGGSRVFARALPQADRLYLTEIHRDVPGDVRFPDFSREFFREVFREEHREADPPFSFLILERRSRTYRPNRAACRILPIASFT
ncbi:MAG: dihydrofolate reductase [Spirochaetota bacterium]